VYWYRSLPVTPSYVIFNIVVPDEVFAEDLFVPQWQAFPTEEDGQAGEQQNLFPHL